MMLVVGPKGGGRAGGEGARGQQDWRRRRAQGMQGIHTRVAHALGDEHEGHEHEVGPGAPAGVDHLQGGVDGGALALDLHGQHREEQHLDGGTAGIPEGAGHAVLEGDVGGLEESRRPGPLAHDVAGGQADLNGATGGTELLAGVHVASVLVTQVHHAGGEEGEDAACWEMESGCAEVTR